MLVMILIVSVLLYLTLGFPLKLFNTFGFLFFLVFSLFFLLSYTGLPFRGLCMLVSPLSGLLDEYSLILNIIIFLVILISFLVFKTKVSSLYIESLGVFCFVLLYLASLLVFSSRSLFWIYFGYEMSLIPIILIIMLWGSYPERMYRGIVILLYTIFFSFPLMSLIIYTFILGISFSLPVITTFFLDSSVLFIFSFVVFCSFAVKLPVYGLHYWLPLAHVEAPTFGSILLAGILLKLGGSAFYRFVSFYNFGFVLSGTVLSFLFWGMVLSSLVCCLQSDMKRLIAYSSVVHMTRVGAGLITCLMIGFKRGLIIIFIHGLSSPLMFFIVGEIYDFLGTRLLILIRGLYFLTPVMFWGMVITFFLSMPVPPVLGFLGEIMLFTRLISVSLKVLIFSFLYIFFAVVFNLYWLRTSFGELRIKVYRVLTISSSWVLLYFPLIGFFIILFTSLF